MEFDNQKIYFFISLFPTVTLLIDWQNICILLVFASTFQLWHFISKNYHNVKDILILIFTRMSQFCLKGRKWQKARERERERQGGKGNVLWFNQIQKVRRNDRGLTLINSSVTDPPRYTTFDWWLYRMLFSVCL